MCRSNCEGGRRCPSNRGDQRRAYQRGRYAAITAREGFEASHTRGGAPSGVTVSDLLDTPVSALSREAREQVRQAARDRVLIGQDKVSKTLDDLCGGMRMSRDDFAAFHRRDNHNLLGTKEARQAMVTANQELGRDIFRAVDCTVQDRLEDARLDDDSVLDEVQRRIDEHPRTHARLRSEKVYAEEKAAAEAAGQLPISERLDAAVFIRPEQPEFTPVDNDELREFLRQAHGDEAVTDDAVREFFNYSRRNEASELQYALNRAQFQLKRAERDGEDPDEIARREASLSKAQEAFDAYDPDPEDPWPRTDRERRTLANDLQSRAEYTDGLNIIVREEANIERREIQRSALLEELSRVQTFGGQTIEPFATGGKVTKAFKVDFDEATSLFPSALVEQAKDQYPRLILRKTSRRAHFSPRSSQEWSEKRDMFITIPSLDTAPEDTFAHEISFHYDKDNPAHRGYPSSPENRKKMQAIVDAHNKGQTRMGATGNNGHRRVLAVAEVSDEDGSPRLVVKAKSQISQKRRGVAAELTSDGSASTTVHELAHMMEADPQVFYACKQFLADRAEGKDKIIYNKSRRHGTEMATPDGFANSYIGKDYPGGPHTEVFSMGMEGIFAAGEGGCRGINEMKMVHRTGLAEYEGVIDTDHRDLVLGILAGYKSNGVMTEKRARELMERPAEERERQTATTGPAPTTKK